MLTEMETMTELAEIKSEIGTGSEGFHGSGSGSVDSNSSSSATPQPHHNFAWVIHDTMNSSGVFLAFLCNFTNLNIG